MMKLMPWNLYDVSAQQAWLEDQAARGWFATSVPGIFFLAVFEKGEPKVVRYRLEPAPVKESRPDPERLAAYRAMGWEYVDTSGSPCTCGGAMTQMPRSFTRIRRRRRELMTGCTGSSGGRTELA